MNVRSPKNGFVIDLFVHNDQSVEAGAPLLQMDSDAEDRYDAHLDILEEMRVVRAGQYTGVELELMRSLAKIAVEVSDAKLTNADKNNMYYSINFRKGLEKFPDVATAESSYEQAKFENERAKSQQQRLELAVKRHDRLNDLAKKWNERQKEFVQVRKGRLRIVAPISGRAKLLVVKGSFAKHGNVLIEMH